MERYYKDVHQCLVNGDRERLNGLTKQKEFTMAAFPADIYVDLIQLRCSNDTIMLFASGATDDNLAVLIATAILQAHVVPLGPLFELMKDAKGAIEKHKLAALFLTVCDHEDTDAVKAMIRNRAFDPAEGRAITTVFRRQCDRSALDKELLSVVLDSHPGHKDIAVFLMENCVASAKHTASKDVMTELLEAYMK